MSVWNMLKIAVVAGTAVACSGPVAEPGVSGDAAPTEAEEVVLERVPTVQPTTLPPVLERVTPILAVEEIESAVPFWEALGFAMMNPSYTGDTLTFAAFAKDGLEIHYQTIALIEENAPATKDLLSRGTSMVYLTVNDTTAIVERLGGAEIIIPRRRTAWQADEIYVKEPGGNIVAFASFGG